MGWDGTEGLGVAPDRSPWPWSLQGPAGRGRNSLEESGESGQLGPAARPGQAWAFLPAPAFLSGRELEEPTAKSAQGGHRRPSG